MDPAFWHKSLDNITMYNDTTKTGRLEIFLLTPFVFNWSTLLQLNWVQQVPPKQSLWKSEADF